MPLAHEEWAANVLGMIKNRGKGVDLLDKKKIVEVKFHMIAFDGNYQRTICWKVLEHQLGYGERAKLPLYFMMGTYRFCGNIEDLSNSVSYPELENMVEERESWIVPSDWVANFPTYRQNGKTKKSEWDNLLKFTYKKYLSHTYKTFNVKKGKVHLTKGVKRKHFDL